MPDGYVTIARFQAQIDADLARLRLEDEEIPVFMADQQTTGANPLYGVAVGVRLQVPEELAEHALTILRDAPPEDGEQALNELFGIDEAEERKQRRVFTERQTACPACESPRVARWDERFPWARVFLFVAALLSMALLPASARHKWYCQRCGHRWRSP